MKKRLRGLYLFISSLVIGILHLSVGFARSASHTTRMLLNPGDSSVRSNPDSLYLMPELKSVYDSLHLNLRGLSQDAFEYAKKGFDKLVNEGKLLNDSVISIIDFSRPSNQKRLFIIDLHQYKVLFNTLVAHGRNTGRELALSFSNDPSSYKSSPGFYITRETYEGHNGYSLKLDGLERGINDKAYQRGIVIHGAPYVNEGLASAQGYIGRSQGCPAVPLPLSRPIINSIKNGTCVFIYHPAYVQQSPLLN
ncbi:MAG: murein L,D-transpeptidase catalytic domain family protein [Sphingobacteriales bacterium]|nr:murein L,D-transpeptidase catalytic domain family protein [Sphingobacteriales bacterium]